MTEPSQRTGVARRRVSTLMLLLAFGLSQLGYVLAVPAFRGIDEFDHAFRASSVGNGHWWAGSRVPENGRGYLIPVDQSIAVAAFQACDDLTYTGPDNCTAVTSANSDNEVEIASAAATYNPVWYALVGWGSAPFAGDQALLAMRIIGALLVLALLGAALGQARASGSPVWLSAGVMIAATPVLAYSTTVAAPNGATYAAGILLWTALLRLRDSSEPTRGTWAALIVASSTVMLTHTTGVLFMPLIGVCAAVLLWSQRSQLLRRHLRGLVVTVASVAAVGAACVTWILAAGTNDPRVADVDEPLGSMPAKTVLTGPLLWFFQSIATLAFRNEAAPLGAYAVGLAVILPLVLLGFRHAARDQRVVIGLILTLSIAVPLLLTWLTYDTQGVAWQGRYTLPLTSGIILVSAHAIGTARRAESLSVIAGALVVASVAGHATTIAGITSALNGPLSPLQLVAVVAASLTAGILITCAFWQLHKTENGFRRETATNVFG